MPRPRSAAGGRLDRSKRRRRGRQSCSSQNDVIDLSLVDRNQTSNMGSQAQRRPDRSRRRRRGIQSCSSQDDVIDLTLVDGNQNSDLRSQPQRRRNHQRAPRRQRPEVFSLDVTYSSDESDELQVDRTPEKALIQPFNFILTPRTILPFG
ncbi:hypothetical protein SK128_006087 [Halocaridina rubra]|uniref:Uncharacterized protein n=1 Tax=Halocaridina rubra TaxID=373956 RepID=A0AAN8XT97_HALRR